MQSYSRKCANKSSETIWKYKHLPEDKRDSIYFETNTTSRYISLQLVKTIESVNPQSDEYIQKNQQLWNIYCKKISKMEPISVTYNSDSGVYSIIKGNDIYLNALTSNWNNIWVDIYEICSSDDMSNYITKLITKINTYAPIITIFLKNIATLKRGKLDDKDIYLEQNTNILFNKLKNNCFLTYKRKKYKTLKMIIPLKYVIVFPYDTYFQSVKDCIQQIERNGYTIIKIDNYWSDDDIYSGLNCISKFYNIEEDIEIVFELQFHTPDSYDLKRKNNKDYILYNKTTNIKEKCKLFDKITKEYENLKIPPKIMENKIHRLEIKHSIPHPCATKPKTI